MEKTVQNIPFLRITVALIAGVITARFFTIGEVLNVLILLAILTALFVINLKYRYSLSVYFGILLNLFFVFLGMLSNTIHFRKPVLYNEGIFSAIVLETPVEKPKSYKSVVRIDEAIVHDSIKSTSEKVIVYFEKSPEAGELEAGDRILFSQVPLPVSQKLNPYDFDFRKYYEQKKIYRQVYLRSEKWENTGLKQFSLVCEAEKLRNQLVNIYREQPIDSVEFEILSALTLGYSRELDPETRRVFSSSGAMHVLSVSGLHVGIIFAVLGFLFAFLKKRKWGRLVFVVIVVSVLWFYAFITGLSPSVLRSTAMFSVFIIGENINRKSNIYNSLVLTAFFLILINPGNLYDIGFQLSYAALFGIVFLQPEFEALFTVRNKVVKYFVALLTVSIAAQLTTFPITSLYFSQFPTYFWLTNLFIIPLTGLLTPLGIALLFVSEISYLSEFVVAVLNSALKISFYLLSEVENLPGSVLLVSIDRWQFVLISLLIVTGFILLVRFKASSAKIFILLFIVLNINFILTEILRQKNRQIIIYNHPDREIIHLIAGKINYLVTDADILNDANIQNTVNLTVRKLGLHQPEIVGLAENFSDNHIILNDRKIVLRIR